jgi:ABC-type sulfate transport system permease subunit
MREELRKPVYEGLYYGTKVFCLLVGGLVCLLCLGVFAFFGIFWIQSLFSERGLPDGIVFSVLNFVLHFLLLAIPFLIAWKIVPLFRNFKEISPEKTGRMAFILGVLVWWVVKESLEALFPEWSSSDLKDIYASRYDGLPFWIAVIVGWVSYHLIYPALSLIGQRLQAGDRKPEDPSGGGEALQKAGGMQDA